VKFGKKRIAMDSRILPVARIIDTTRFHCLVDSFESTSELEQAVTYDRRLRIPAVYAVSITRDAEPLSGVTTSVRAKAFRNRANRRGETTNDHYRAIPSPLAPFFLAIDACRLKR